MSAVDGFTIGFDHESVGQASDPGHAGGGADFAPGLAHQTREYLDHLDITDDSGIGYDQSRNAAGMRFEPHSYDHPDMRNRDFDFVVFQILAPKEAIEARTGEPCRFFAYPAGRYDQFVIDVLDSANFWGAVLTEQGATHTVADLFTLQRVRIRGEDTLNDFARKLHLDW